MANIISSQTGTWADSSTWVGGVSPGIGDSFVISLNHTVTVDEDVVTGDSTDNVVNGTLVIGDNISLTCSGTLRINNSGTNGSFYMTEGSTLDLSSGAYNIFTATGYGGFGAHFSMIGTSSNRCNVIGGAGIWTGSFGNSGITTVMRYVNVTGFTGAGINGPPGKEGVTIKNCLFSGNRGWSFGSGDMESSAVYSITNNDFRGILPSTQFNIVRFGGITEGYTTNPEISGNTFVGNGEHSQQAVYFSNIVGFSLVDNVLYNIAVYGLSEFHGNTWEGTQVYADSDDASWTNKSSMQIGFGNTIFTSSIVAGITNNYHGIENGNSSDVSGVQTISNSVFYSDWTSPESTSNLILTSNFNDANITHNIVLGANAGFLPDTIAKDIVFENNTFANFNLGGGPTTQQFHAVLSEFNYRTSGVGKFSSNLIYNNGENTDNYGFVSTKVEDLTVADYNAWDGIVEANRYANATPGFGVNDIVVEPEFVDPTRDLDTYAVLSGDFSIVDVFTGSVKRNGFDIDGNSTSFNDAYTASNILSYIQEGFTPTNTALLTAGEAGTYIGAVEPIVVASDGLAKIRPSISPKIFDKINDKTN